MGKSRKKTAKPVGRIVFKCVTFKQGRQKLILFAASAKKLWSIVDINRKEEDKDIGYQRVLSPARAKKISEFIDKQNVLPASVLISFDTGSLSRDEKTLTIPRKSNAGWVIDGQHRLAGAHRAKTDIVIPVVAFLDLDIDDQIDCFVTINREQKGVSTSLYLDLLKVLPKRSEADLTKERAAGIATELKKDENSPFYNRIIITVSPKKGEVSLTNVVRKLVPLIKHDGRLSTFTIEECKRILDNYYSARRQVFPDEFERKDSVFFRTVGFGALMNTLPTFLDLTIKHYKGFRVSDAIKVFREVEDYSFREWARLGSGTKAENSAAEDLRVTLLERLGGNSETGAIRLE